MAIFIRLPFGDGENGLSTAGITQVMTRDELMRRMLLPAGDLARINDGSMDTCKCIEPGPECCNVPSEITLQTESTPPGIYKGESTRSLLQRTNGLVDCAFNFRLGDPVLIPCLCITLGFSSHRTRIMTWCLGGRRSMIQPSVHK